MVAMEINFDGLVGPTHNYAGLSHGNLASREHRLSVSNPRQAALQGLAKMKFLADLGLRQAVLPPQERPDLLTLRRLGFSGSDAQVLQQARAVSPELLASCYSASSMWAANAATVSPSLDTADGRVHFTPANLVSQFHRSLEPATTGRILQAIFSDQRHFAHHPPLPASLHFGDEGAANHSRLCRDVGEPGIELFVYGRDSFNPDAPGPRNYPARQTRSASEAVARLHRLDPARTLFLQQNPAAIDAGAFHNDVVAVGNQNVLIYHAGAYLDAAAILEMARRGLGKLGVEPFFIEVPENEVPLADAVRSYLFNCQLVTLPDGKMAMICPTECQEIASSRGFLERLVESGTPIRRVHFVDVRHSMHNGGGPACLRLRVVLNEAQIAAAASGVFLTDTLYAALVAWVTRHYRDRLQADDLADPRLIDEGRAALDELTKLLGLGSMYPFQGASG
ncbi:MAG: astB [Phycisphaerales bacterium]|nr:astB [Phycisphaerales bacterium]